ncbi:DM4/DM12 family [Popillia japonica]|uniref:DM4/DM12 family n=1 Tax=Popillia japonica TaxID=7064 RepID=A0AAW1JGW6_POPJA
MTFWESFKWFTLTQLLITSSDVNVDRTKRWIMYPGGGQAKVVLGIAWPVKLGSKQAMSCTVNFQFEFQEPQNFSIFHQWPPIIRTRSLDYSNTKRESSDRMIAYQSMETVLTSYGMNGRACLLRGICENAMDSVHHDGNGILGELLHIFLSPDYGDGEVDTDLDPVYVDAQQAGYYGVDCLSLYPNCPYGSTVLDVISAFL